MQKVISINLNGNAYQLDEERLRRAARVPGDARSGQLKDNPDRAEIMADLEQAIADKCQRYLGSHKSVVTAAEVGADHRGDGTGRPRDRGRALASRTAPTERNRRAAPPPRPRRRQSASTASPTAR